MKSQFNKIISLSLKKIGVIALIITLNYGCYEKNPVLSTFTGDMVYTFLAKDTTYSEYLKIIDRAGLKGMLSAYGEYTCLAPTNAAFRAYYHSLGTNVTINSLRKGQIDTIARTHIIPKIYLTLNLSNGVIPNTNMNDRYIEIKIINDTIKNSLKIVLNDSTQIISKDHVVYNGVVHRLNGVLTASNYLLPDLISTNPDISIFSEALSLTHLSDSLKLIRDESYSPSKIYKDLYDKYTVINPSERKFGYTVFVEDNQVLKANGINTIKDLINKANELYPEGKEYENDFTNRKNSLNQYIAYHLVEKVIFANKFFYTSHAIQNYIPDEFIETMLPNRLIRASKINTTTTLNTDTKNTVHVLGNGGKATINGTYHLLDNMLVYTDDVENRLKNIRIRFDFAALFPELANNNMRCSRNTNFSDGDEYCYEPGYIKYVKMSKDTRLYYLSGRDDFYWMDYQGDDVVALGAYDVTIRLLPVPPGTYELRFGYTANDNRSITQIYFDNKPVDIPLDLKIAANDPRIGWIMDGQTDDNGFENDKMMRNRRYMKGPNTIMYPNGTISRNLEGALRRIIGTFTFDDYEPHYLRFKSVVSDQKKQLQLDYLEYVPKIVYNNASGEPETRD